MLDALGAIVGASNVLTDAGMVAGYLTEPRGLFAGRRPRCRQAGFDSRGRRGREGLRRGARGDRPAGRQHRPRRRPDSRRQRRRDRAVAGSHEADTRDRPADRYDDRSKLASRFRKRRRRQTAPTGCSRSRSLPRGPARSAATLPPTRAARPCWRYGNARELTVGVEVVLADGRIVNALSKLRKDNTGYDLKDLFVGSEGTLGIITAAALKLFPKPRSRVTAFIGLATPEDALALFRLAREKLGQSVVSFELMKRIAVQFVLAHGENVRDPLPGDPPLVRALGGGGASRRADSTKPSRACSATAWSAGSLRTPRSPRRSNSATISGACANCMSDVQKLEGGSIKHDVSVPVGVVPEFITRADLGGGSSMASGPRRPVRPHGRRQHPLQRQPADRRRSRRLPRSLGARQRGRARRSRRLGGSFSAEHGIGRLKRDLLAQAKDPVALDVMRRLKKALDPDGVLNPGKML